MNATTAPVHLADCIRSTPGYWIPGKKARDAGLSATGIDRSAITFNGRPRRRL
jgi:hypothetical protein